MAERRDIASVKAGSDADIEFACTPCGDDKIREEAIKYCPECEEYLCVTCTRCHNRMKVSRLHKLLDMDDAKQGPTVGKTTKCPYHPDRNIEMYCGAHDMVYCTKCIATEHRSCDGVDVIENCQTDSLQEDEIQRLQNEMQMVQEHIKAASKITQKNISTLDEQKMKILQQFEDAAQNLIGHITKLKTEGIKVLIKDHTEIKTDLETDVTMMAKAVTEVEESTKRFQNVTRMDAGQQFVHAKLVHRTVADAKNLCEESERKGSKSVCFVENVNLKKSITTATSLGEMCPMTENKQYQLKQKKDIIVKVKGDKNMCFVSDICWLQDGMIILTDQDNNKIKTLDKKYKVKDYLNLDASPRAICCTGEREVAVKMNNNKVQFISVGNVLQKRKKISIFGGALWGMACCAGELWISTRNGIRVYNTSGVHLKTVAKNENGQKIFKSVPQHMCASGENVIVADNTDGAICIAKDSTVTKVTRQIRDRKLSNTRSAFVSKDGTMFLSGYNSGNIVTFNSEGKFQGELVVEEQHPGQLLHNDKMNSVILTCLKASDYIHVFEVCD